MLRAERRLHLPIITNNKVGFKVERKIATMNIGKLWYINKNFIFSVVNQSKEDRINLVIDYEVNDCFKELIV
jgi:hypothetical protein